MDVFKIYLSVGSRTIAPEENCPNPNPNPNLNRLAIFLEDNCPDTLSVTQIYLKRHVDV